MSLGWSLGIGAGMVAVGLLRGVWVRRRGRRRGDPTWAPTGYGVRQGGAGGAYDYGKAQAGAQRSRRHTPSGRRLKAPKLVPAAKRTASVLRFGKERKAR